MSHYNAKPVRLDLRPSRRLTWLLGGAVCAACAAIGILPISLWVKSGIVLFMLAASAFHIMRDARLALRSSILALEVSASGELSMLTREQGWRVATVRGDSFVTPPLTVLVLAPEGQRLSRYAVLLPDSADAEALRRLRVWLKWGNQNRDQESGDGDQ
ncbi:MAG: hypothetical protein LBE24_01025 [Methylobacillus sp.]|jgi:toxin CptA|nr:hypothetical protein [Methylobacillus sp.]